ncbi:MAG TPA: LapA family protein [Candidatus Accumulibacter phosphatis]|mgnify:CR=1 FL=1|nr:DUF1049 domain-containing protein [Accumulibacter sp.]HRL76986.1 LapA family protein [Candidatus Accumulibacter phosphatis]HRQ94715.1 LapA family protein [Candidatus Accumulibacter phosphatis]
MRLLRWVWRILLFLFLLSFAIRNTDPVGVRFFFGTVWQAPLVIVLLVTFAAGAALAVVSLLGTVFGLRRQVAHLQRRLPARQADAGSEPA